MILFFCRSHWGPPEELQEAAERSSVISDEEMSDDIRAIRFHLLEEDGGAVGRMPRSPTER